ncbi:MAG: septal ring lytic transglycosylase RlpA family protein [Rhodospirillales bacterium]|nr:septal ring lytic transglycosylase RlpA family protein [Rhodospirillales bacterium]
MFVSDLRAGDGCGRSHRGAVAGALVALAALAGCSGADPETPPASLAAAETFQPGATAVPSFKIGKPYTINGVWYRPAVDWDYVEEGVASWYGSAFHGRTTANGERFDMYDLSAAHRTLPLPSIVQVTNLENGRSLRLRVNDRGPFARSRIIDVSKTAAKALGFFDQGTARVRVQLVADESMRLAGLSPQPAQTVAMAPVAATTAPVAVPVATAVAMQPAAASMPAAARADAAEAGRQPPAYRTYSSRSFIQAGAFADGGNASRAGMQLAHLAPVVITYGALEGPNYYRVRLGPLASADEADRVLAEVIRAGYPGSRVVVE